MDIKNNTLKVHSHVLFVARSYQQPRYCVVRNSSHVETFCDATFGRATRWREDSGPAETLCVVPKHNALAIEAPPKAKIPPDTDDDASQ